MYDWDAIIQRLRKNPGLWVLALPNVPTSTEKLVRLRRNPKLRLEGEIILASARNIHGEGRQSRCDLYLKLEGA